MYIFFVKKGIELMIYAKNFMHHTSQYHYPTSAQRLPRMLWNLKYLSEKKPKRQDIYILFYYKSHDVVKCLGTEF